MLKCIYCGLCQESCPVDAIVQGPNFEFATETRESFITTKKNYWIMGIDGSLVIAKNLKTDKIYK